MSPNNNIENEIINNQDSPEETVKYLIPIPASIRMQRKEKFILTPSTNIYVYPGTKAMVETGSYLAQRLKPATGFTLNVSALPSKPVHNSIILSAALKDASLGEEGYLLKINNTQVTISAQNSTGVFWGLQTLRQLLPAAIEDTACQNKSLILPGVTIKDIPRFSYRGFMIDGARHVFSIDEIKHFIDILAYYKLNRLHLHLTDDQGWRIEILSRPNLITIGAGTQVNGGQGGYFSQAQYSDIINYANSRHIMVIPEIDMPGHCMAACASYPEINLWTGAEPKVYTGTAVGLSAFDINKEETYLFIDDVIREVAALTPGPYIHIGGDECPLLPKNDYIKFINRAKLIVEKYGKHLFGWEEISQAALTSSTVVQHWNFKHAEDGYRKGAKVVLSPASKVYLDIKYNETTPPYGKDWSGLIEIDTAYNWEPLNCGIDIPETGILGIESCLWTEQIRSLDAAEFLIFPRLIGHADIGWAPKAKKNWDNYKMRLIKHTERLDKMGIQYYKSAILN